MQRGPVPPPLLHLRDRFVQYTCGTSLGNALAAFRDHFCGGDRRKDYGYSTCLFALLLLRPEKLLCVPHLQTHFVYTP